MPDAEKMAEYISDARAMGVLILPPDINVSDTSFTPLPEERKIRFGLSGIKHVGDKAVKEIVAERKKNGPFSDLFQFVERVKSTLVNSRCLDSLVSCGALDGLPGTREEKKASLENAIKRADCLAEDKKRIADGKKPVNRKNPIPEPVLVSAPRDEMAMLSGEREMLGYFLSDHPFNHVDKEGLALARQSIMDVREMESGAEVVVAGIVSRLTEHTTKKNKQKMYFGAIEDTESVLEFVVFPRDVKNVDRVLSLDAPVLLKGRVDSDLNEDGTGFQTKVVVAGADKIAPPKVLKGIKTLIIRLTDNYADEIRKARSQRDDWTHLQFILPNDEEVGVLP